MIESDALHVNLFGLYLAYTLVCVFWLYKPLKLAINTAVCNTAQPEEA